MSWPFVDFDVQVLDILRPHGELEVNTTTTVRVADVVPADLPVNDDFLFVAVWSTGYPPGAVYHPMRGADGVVMLGSTPLQYLGGLPLANFASGLTAEEFIEAFRDYVTE